MSTLAQALRNAIEAEKAAAQFYESLVPKADDADTRTFLERMAAEEHEHAAEIERFADELNAGELPAQPDADPRAIETAPSWRAAPSISFEDALQLALESETHAALYYDAIADGATGETEQFFRRLARHEQEHADVLRSALERNA